MNIPKDTTACYDNLTTTDLTVRGHLKVTGILTAKHIQGDGYIEAGEVVCDTLQADTLRAEIATTRKIAVKKLFVQDCRATDAIVVTDVAESASRQTGRFTAAMFSISDLKADELIILPKRNRGMLGTLFASWLRILFSRPPKEKKAEKKPPVPQDITLQEPDGMDELTDRVISELERRGYLIPPQMEKAA